MEQSKLCLDNPCGYFIESVKITSRQIEYYSNVNDFNNHNYSLNIHKPHPEALQRHNTKTMLKVSDINGNRLQYHQYLTSMEIGYNTIIHIFCKIVIYILILFQLILNMLGKSLIRTVNITTFHSS